MNESTNTCNECGASLTSNNEYCQLCGPHMLTNKGDNMNDTNTLRHDLALGLGTTVVLASAPTQYVGCSKCGDAMHISSTPTGDLGYSCPRCMTQEGASYITVCDNRDNRVCLSIVPNQVFSLYRDLPMDKCPTCREELTQPLAFEGASCMACYKIGKAEEGVCESYGEGQLYAEQHLKYFETVREFYGSDVLASRSEWKMFNDRDPSAIATEANSWGLNPGEVLSRAELEDTNRAHETYEEGLHDDIDYPIDSDFNPALAKNQPRDTIKMLIGMPEELIPVKEERAHTYGTFLPKQQRECNFSYFLSRIEKTLSLDELYELVDYVMESVNNTKVEMENEEGDIISVPCFFPKGGLSDFWAAVATREEYIPSHALELSYLRILKIIEETMENTPSSKVIKEFSNKIKDLESVILWSSLKYARDEEKPFDFDFYSSIKERAIANKDVKRAS